MDRFSKKSVSEVGDWLEEQNMPSEVIEIFKGMGECSMVTCDGTSCTWSCRDVMCVQIVDHEPICQFSCGVKPLS